MQHLRHLSDKKLRKIRFIIGDAFITIELFREFGNIEERRPLVMRYMSAYVDLQYKNRVKRRDAV
jgi:hypothetical protein